ncbi:MAG: hypothetical protein ACOZAJ_03995 [Patescibacteria group bacterium]
MIKNDLLSNSIIKLSRQIIGELGLGLLAAWWLMWLVELLRPGSVSLYLDLNLILVLALVAWLIGSPIKQTIRTAGYLWLVLSVIIISVLLFRLIG